MRYTVKFGYSLAAAIAVTIAILAVLSLLPQSEEDRRAALSEPDETEQTVTMVLRQQDSDFWQTVAMGAEAAAKEFGVQLRVETMKDEDDADAQLALVRKALGPLKSDALVIAAVDDARTAKTIHGAKQPVIAIDTDINAPEIKAFIGINNYEAGVRAGEKMAELLDGEGHVMILSSLKGGRNTEQRVHGILDALKKAAFITVLDSRFCMSGIEYCRQVTGHVMDKTLVEGIIALDSVAAIGAAHELQSRPGGPGKTKIVSFDSAHEQLELLQDGILQATIVQNPFSMGYLGVKDAAEALNGRAVDRRLDIQTKVIDIDNMFWMDNQKLLFPFVK